MNRRKSLFLPTLLLSLVVGAQDKIETDRPTESLTAKTVGKGAFQVETGIRKNQQNSTDYTTRHPDIEWRYGLFSALELQLGTVAETEYLPSKGKTAYGLLPIEVGTKATVLQTKDTSLVVGLYGRIGLPQWAAKDHQLDKPFYRARLMVDKEFSKTVSVQINAGRDWQSSEQEQVWVYAFSPHFNLGNKWQAFAEGYGYLQKGDAPEHYLSAGLAYYINNNVELDVNAGKGLTAIAATYFVTAGFSFRLK